MLHALIEGNGPLGSTTVGGNGLDATGSVAGNNLNPNSGYQPGFIRTTKTQFQINGLTTLPPGILGATGGLFIAEAGFQWADIKKSNGTNARYGRAFAFDSGQHAAYNIDYAAQGNCPTTLADGCKNDGYMTPFAWGYRMKAELTYPGFAGTSWQFKPSVYWSHDVDGVSVDYQMQEDRKTLSLSAGFSLNNVHDVELNYTTYANDATWNTQRDKDNVSLVYRYTF